MDQIFKNFLIVMMFMSSNVFGSDFVQISSEPLEFSILLDHRLSAVREHEYLPHDPILFPFSAGAKLNCYTKDRKSGEILKSKELELATSLRPLPGDGRFHFKVLESQTLSIKVKKDPSLKSYCDASLFLTITDLTVVGKNGRIGISGTGILRTNQFSKFKSIYGSARPDQKKEYFFITRYWSLDRNPYQRNSREVAKKDCLKDENEKIVACRKYPHIWSYQVPNRGIEQDSYSNASLNYYSDFGISNPILTHRP